VRNIKAWANGPGYGGIVVKALKARNKYWSAAKDGLISRLQRSGFAVSLPGALPQAVALRTFGAD